jgi:transcriptional regulator with XRE-family HTH domain
VLDRILSTGLKGRRQALGLTQQEVAARSGLPQNHYSRIERGLSDPRLTTLHEIARALSLEVMLVPSELVGTVNALANGAPAPEDRPLFSAEPD